METWILFVSLQPAGQKGRVRSPDGRATDNQSNPVTQHPPLCQTAVKQFSFLTPSGYSNKKNYN